MLNDLKYNLDKYKRTPISNTCEKDAETACNVVDILFKYINICVRDDKSKIKINKLEKSFIQSLLSDKIRGGVKNYVANMTNRDLRLLLDEIQKELDR